MRRIGKIFAIVFALFLSLSVNSVNATEYPSPAGFVNDFANILSPQTKDILSAKLSEYEKATTIEIAVVTTPSLYGLSVEEYTITLAQNWGVGKKKKDNGVVILVAPKERKMRIEVGTGLEPDLTDTASGRIIRDTMIPHFKNGDFPAGIVAGINAVVDTLGNTPYEARVEERRIKEKEAKEKTETVFIALFVTLVILVCGFGLFKFTAACIARRRENLRLKTENKKLVAACEQNIAEAQQEHTKNAALISAFMENHPKEVWKELKHIQDFVPGHIVALKKTIVDVSGMKHTPAETNEILKKLEKETRALSSFDEKIKSEIQKVQYAKKEGLRLLKDLPHTLNTADAAVTHEDVSGDVRKAFHNSQKDARALLSEIQDTMSTNWLVCYNQLLNMHSRLDEIRKEATAEKKYAETARTQGPKLLQSLPSLIRNTETELSAKKLSQKTRKMLQDARQKHTEAQQMSRAGTTVDMVAMFALLSAAASLLEGAKENVHQEELAEERRKEEEKRRKEEEERRRRRRRRDASYSSSGSGFSSSSSSSGFGGFSGGGFSGGGASGSW
ncbi:MAG: TPM domain-containing protein [Parcubacteria group bacterium]|nr:TPM domain-containing protein [Parcubacteria group bacterium]